MFTKFFIGGFVFFSFFMTKALAVQEGEIFWEVKKPGIAPNYLIGTKHDVILNENSLPPELVSALKNAKAGLFEVISEDIKKQINEAKKKRIWLPSGKTLSLYIGEEKTQRIFKAIQSALAQLDEEFVSTFSNDYKKLNVDVNSYKDFNKLTPINVFGMMGTIVHRQKIVKKQGLKPNNIFSKKEKTTDKISDEQEDAQKSSVSLTEDEDDNIQDGKSDMEMCFSRQNPMDIYFEKTLSCMGRPVHSLESVETQVSAISSIVSNEDMAEQLSQSADIIIRVLAGGQLSEIEKTVGEWGAFANQVQRNLHQITMRNYYQDIKVDSAALEMNIQQKISNFLKEKQCSTLPESSLNQFVAQNIKLSKVHFKQFVTGQRIEGEIERKLAKSIKEVGRIAREITSFCFPDYIWPSNMEEKIASGERFMLNALKREVEFIILSRDQKQAIGMLPYFEEGGAFSAVGFAHLSGVLRELEVQGYELRLIELSVPLKEVDGSQSNSSDSFMTEVDSFSKSDSPHKNSSK